MDDSGKIIGGEALEGQFRNLAIELNKIDTTKSTHELQQIRANLIDLMQSINPLVTSTEQLSLSLTLQEKKLEAQLTLYPEVSQEAQLIQNKLFGIRTQLRELNPVLARNSIAVRNAAKGITDIAAVIAKSAKELKEFKESLRFKEGDKAIKTFAKNLPEGINTIASHFAGKLAGLAKVGSKLLPMVGTFSLIATIVSELLSRSTRQTAALAEAYGASGTAFIRAQAIFKTKLPITYIYSFAEADAFLNKVLAKGAFTAYTAAQSFNTLATATRMSTTNMEITMAGLTNTMLIAGRALGMTDDNAAGFLSDLYNIGTVFADTTATNWGNRLRQTLNIFTNATREGYGSFNTLSGLFLKFSKVTRMLGQSSTQTLINVLGMSKAISEYAKQSHAVSAEVLKNENGMREFQETLFDLGNRISMTAAAGYGMLAGNYTAGSFADIVKAGTAAPLQKLAMQISALSKISTSDDMLFTMLLQSGYSGQTVKILQDMKKSQSNSFTKLVASANSQNYSSSELARLARTDPGFAKIAKTLELGKNPLVTLVKLVTNILEELTAFVAKWGVSPASTSATSAKNYFNPGQRRLLQ